MTNTATARAPHVTTCNRIDWSKIDDRAFVDALVQRDSGAWREFDRRYRPEIRKRVKSTTRRCPAAQRELEDIVANIFCALLEGDCAKLRRFDAAKGTLGAWLQAVTQNNALSYMRTVRCRPEGQQLVEVEQSEIASRQCGARWIAEGT